MPDEKVIRQNEHTQVLAGTAIPTYRIKSADPGGEYAETEINFQEGPISKFGVNGCDPRDVIAVLIHHLRGKQDLEPTGYTALKKLREALMWMDYKE